MPLSRPLSDRPVGYSLLGCLNVHRWVAGREISVRYAVAYFAEYRGRQPKEAWRKPVVAAPDRPFAELQVVGRSELRSLKP